MFARDVNRLEPIPDGPYKLVCYRGFVLAVFNCGKIWDVAASKNLTTHKDRDGYLIGNKRGRAFKIHRLILIVWDRPPLQGKREQALHKNDIKHDNKIGNLYWGCGVQNWKDRKRNLGPSGGNENRGRNNVNKN